MEQHIQLSVVKEIYMLAPGGLGLSFWRAGLELLLPTSILISPIIFWSQTLSPCFVMDDWYGIRAKPVVNDPVNNRIIKVTKQTKRWFIIFYLVIWNFMDFTSELCLCRRKWYVYIYLLKDVLYLYCCLADFFSLTKKNRPQIFVFLYHGWNWFSFVKSWLDMINFGWIMTINYTSTNWIMHDVILLLFLKTSLSFRLR